MKARIQAIATKINSVTPRERFLLTAVGIVVIYMLFELAFMQKHEKAVAKTRGEMSQLSADIAGFEAQINEISAQFEHDPDAAEKAQKKEVEGEIAAFDKQLEQKMGGLVTPSRMAEVLERVLLDQKGLRLANLKSLAPQPLLPSPKVDAGAVGETKPVEPAPTVGIYRHGLVLELEGDYMSTLEYARQLERLPWKLYWDVLDYEVTQYPKARVRIQVHTLSTDAKWIGV
jgi:MSHA biogenesis protein MshJ